MSEAAELAETMHPLITQDRDTGNGYAISLRHYEAANEAEIVAIKLTCEDSLKRGGGARRKNTKKGDMDEITINKSVARSKTNLRRKLLSMCADRMLTLTFRENVTDIEEAWAVFKYFTRLMRQKYGKQFCYVAVPEYQKRGAVHFHLAVSGWYRANVVRKLWRQASGRRGGNIDITSARKAENKNGWNPKRIASYLSKYMSKQDSVVFNKRRYSAGGDIKVPPPEKGWIALGSSVISVMGDVLTTKTGKQVACVWESEGFFGITYLST